MKIGYIQYANDESSITLQIKALENLGITEIFKEKIIVGDISRPELKNAINSLDTGDTLVVWKLDNISRNLRELFILLIKIESIGAGFQSITENIDTITPDGKMMMRMVKSFIEFERSKIYERNQRSSEEIRRNGIEKAPGRPPKLSIAQQDEIRAAVQSERHTPAECAVIFGVSESTISRILSRTKLDEL